MLSQAAMLVWIFLILGISNPARGLSFFCTQFRPLKVQVNETAKPGSVIKTILPPDDQLSSVVLISGDSSYLSVSLTSLNLRLRKPVRDRRGQTLIIAGKCSDFLEPYQYLLNISISIEVEILDVNDPPQFINLPTSTHVAESAEVGSWVFDVQADNPDDVYKDFTKVRFSILSSGSVDKPQTSVEDWFTMDTNGRVLLNRKLDYEEGPRQIKLIVKVQDFGSPAKRNISTLTVMVEDVDDMNPVFDHRLVSLTIIGEKPVITEECYLTIPELTAEDGDIRVKSPIGYRLEQVKEISSIINWSKYFRINPLTGQLCQQHTIEINQPRRGDIPVVDSTDFFNLTVQAFQLDNPDKYDEATVMVKISNENLYKPTFTHLLYNTTIREYPEVAVGTYIATVHAEDKDYGHNGKFELSLSENPFDAFSIHPSTGEIRVSRPEFIDRERNQTITIKVKATETESTERHVSDPEAEVEITLTDVNDNSPVFRESLHNFTVKDNHPVGTPIHKFTDRLIAEDADQGHNGRVRMAIVSVQNLRGTFSLNDFQRFRITEDGVVILQSSLRPLRREEHLPEYIVMVQARDMCLNEKQQRSGTTRIYIQVLEANDYPPVFEDESYQIYISEAAPIGTLISEIKVTDEDGDEDLYVKYDITSGNHGDDFRISERGFLFTDAALDREKTDLYQLTVSASDGIHKREVTVRVDVTDTNDNSPQFAQSMFDFSVPENMSASHSIGVVAATDEDDGPNSKLVYRLTGEHVHIFNITEDGELIVNGGSHVMDREKTEVIILQVEAEDLGQPPQKEEAMIRIFLQDVNDEPPVFTKPVYHVKMKEPISGDYTLNQPITTDGLISVTDEDVDPENRDVTFSLENGSDAMFYIDNMTGVVFLKNSSSIDCERRQVYYLQITATNGNFTAHASLRLDIEDRNDNQPVFNTTNLNITISPSKPFGSVVSKIMATDDDVTEQNSHLVYLLLGGSLDKFSIDSNTGEIRVIDDLIKPPYRDVYSLKVKVVDFGHPQLSSEEVVTVNVRINQSPVVSQKMVFRVNESYTTESVIGRILATDPDGGELLFDISGGDDTLPFYISRHTGEIRLAARLDTEERDVYTFPVDVINPGEPDIRLSTYVTVYVDDVNDEEPLFSSWFYTAEVEENNGTNSDTEPLRLSPDLGVTDEDAREDDHVVYRLVGPGSEDFVIDRLTGVIVVKQESNIDCERRCEYDLQLIARDENGKGLEGCANLRINILDINDNPPVIRHANPSVKVDPTAPIGSSIGHVIASDADRTDINNRLTFTLKDGGAGKFFIHPTSGVIALSNSLLQEPVQEVYNMVVMVTDSGQPTLSVVTTVTVSVPINVPVTINSSVEIEVAEDVAVGDVIWDVRGDTGKNLSFSQEEDSDVFQVMKENGTIVLVKELDAEETGYYSLPVLVVDHGHPTYTLTTTIDIKILDVNDNPPSFSTPSYQTQISENNDVKVITKLSIVPPLDVTDPDVSSDVTNITYRLLGDGADMFTMDETTGEITVASGRQLDCESKCSYVLQIEARDENGFGLSSQAGLNITVKDKNDHRPEFTGNFSFHVKPSVPIGREIGTVLATDEDVDAINNRLLYYLTGLGGYGKFHIETDTGTIYTTDSLLRAPVLEDYYIKVVAVDFGSPQLSRETTVHIHVPVHPLPEVPGEITFTIKENEPVDTFVGKIHINTSDKINFILGRKSDQFTLNKTTGALTTRSMLDTETKSEYTVPVSITEVSNGLYTITTLVNVMVADVDDHLLAFTSSQYKTQVMEGLYPKQQRLHLEPQLELTDGDVSPVNKKYTLSLRGNHSDAFYIDSDTNKVFVKPSTLLDSENTSLITLQVVAKSTAGVETYTDLEINVEDVNDHSPEFVSSSNFSTSPSLPVGSAAGRVEAVDGDYSSPNNRVVYFLKSGGGEKLDVVSDTGEIILRKSFAEEPLRSEFHLLVEARDLGFPVRTATATINIAVPINKPPIVPQDVTFDLQEIVALGTLLPPLGVIDPDSQDYLLFTILDNTVPFILDGQQLRTSDVINAEKNRDFKFKVEIIDEGIPSFTMTSSVTINITDVNDNLPLFKAERYRGRIKEHSASNTVDITPAISVEDSDITSRPEEVVYSLEDDEDDLFTIHPQTAVIQATDPLNLDCERKCQYELKIRATDNYGKGLSSTAPLTITLEDVNDQAPTFEFVYSVHLNVSTLPDWEVAKVKAVDSDREHPNNQVIYLLEDGFGKFNIDSKTGRVWLSHSLLEGDVQDKYDLMIKAIDAGIPTQTGITMVTVNVIRNHPPVLASTFTFTLKEDHPVRTSVGEIRVSDPDGLDNIIYSINDSEVPFYIGPESGELFTTSTLDRETADKYHFNVYVIDTGVPSYTVTSLVTVLIGDVNDNPPEFSKRNYEFSFAENQLLTEIPLVPNVTDLDATEVNRRIRFSLDQPDDVFVVDEITGKIRAKVPLDLDCEKRRVYKTTLVAFDGRHKTSQPISVSVTDENDHRPITEKHTEVTLPPDSDVGIQVAMVTATDNDCSEANNELTYILNSGGMGKFTLDATTGVIKLAENLLQEPFSETYNLLIEVIDSGKPRLSSETTVDIKVPLNKPPIVPEVVHLQVLENTTVNTVVGIIQVVEDETKDGLIFIITNTTAPFNVDRRSGEITLLSDLDSETIDQHSFQVVVVKPGFPTINVTTQVIIEILDVNDNYPEFSSSSGYVGYVDEDDVSRDVHHVIKMEEGIEVQDKDVTLENRHVRLRLLGSVLFDLDGDSNDVILTKHGFLDAETKSVYHLLLEARDQDGHGLLASTNVTIYINDVNDNAPIFHTIDDVSISYLTPVGSHVTTVMASDADVTEQNNHVTYMLRDGGHGKFHVNPDSGDVIVADDLSREPCLEMYTLYLVAMDNGFPRQTSNTTVNISVPINQPPLIDPIINITVLENEDLSTNVAQINIEDPDLLLNKHESIEFYLDDIDAPFQLDKYSGMLRTNGPIDRELTDHMSFMVRVVNDGAPPYTASTMVTVSVNDTNDNPPVFSSPTGYHANIPENISETQTAFVSLNQEFNVTDEDETEENRNIVVSLVGEGDHLFQMDLESGKLRLLDPTQLDCEVKCRYDFKLTATDQNGEGMSTSTSLTVYLEDVNDQSPRFLDNYTFSITAQTHPGLIGRVQADDQDVSSQNNQITFLLKSGGYGKFSIDSVTGEISLVDSLSREPNLDKYNLEIIIQDNGVPRRSAISNVTINVPVNHPPVVHAEHHDLEVPENVPVGQRLTRIVAEDKDEDQNLTYSIKEKRVPFSIDATTGWITVQSPLDRESNDVYKFHVLVTDGGRPELTSSSNVRVTVLDVNDNVPVFEGGNVYQGFVNENYKDRKSRQVVRLDRNISVVDHDSTFPNRKVRVFLYGLGSNLFKLNPKTGQIFSARSTNIDREIHDFFHFKVIAVDTGTPALTSTATVLISVGDVNDHYPQFLTSSLTFTAPSDLQPGGVIGRAMAVDNDATQPNNLLLYLLEDEPSGKFKIDINTGTLSVSEGFFSPPIKPIYTFNVTARDLGFPAGITTTEVTIRVPEVNFSLYHDNNGRHTVILVPEELPTGSTIGRLGAENGYGIKDIQMDPSHAESVPFRVRQDGSVVTNGRIDRDKGRHFYNFQVLTAYNCTPPLQTTRDVTAIIDDVNDNPPAFPLKEYTHTVSKSFPQNTVVATPLAFDEVDEKPSAYRYSLTGPYSECFHINKTSGVVMTTDRLRNATSPQILSYTVTARDVNNPLLFARTKLRIHLLPGIVYNGTQC